MYERVRYIYRNSTPLHVPVPVASAYTGPGDIVSGAAAWYGLRAYSSAQCSGTTPAIQVNSSVSGDQDIFILTTGNLDWATLNALTGTVVLKKIYDQTVAGLTLTLRGGTGAGSTMVYQPAGLGSDRGSWDNSTSGDYISASTLAFAEGMATVMVLAMPTAGAGALAYFGTGSTNTMFAGARVSGSFFLLSSDGDTVHEITKAAVGGDYAAVVNNFNGASSQVFVNASGGTVGQDGPTGGVTETFCWGSAPTVGGWGTPSGHCEFGIWLSGIMNGTQVTNLYNNAKTFWGFP